MPARSLDETVTAPRSDSAPAGSLTSTYCNVELVCATTADTRRPFAANAKTALSPGILCSAIFCAEVPYPIYVTTAVGVVVPPCQL